MAITSELKRPDTLPRAQFFITRILGGENLPDYDFMTLPTDRSLQRYTLDDVQEWMKSAGAGYPTYSERFDGDYLLTMLRRMLLQAASGSTAASHYERIALEEFVADIYEAQPLPIMQSPLIGKTLAELAKAAGGGVAFYSMFPHPGVGEVAIFFLLIGGTRIIFGTSDGIANGLKHGLSYRIQKWMGVPKPEND